MGEPMAAFGTEQTIKHYSISVFALTKVLGPRWVGRQPRINEYSSQTTSWLERRQQASVDTEACIILLLQSRNGSHIYSVRRAINFKHLDIGPSRAHWAGSVECPRNRFAGRSNSVYDADDLSASRPPKGQKCEWPAAAATVPAIFVICNAPAAPSSLPYLNRSLWILPLACPSSRCQELG